MKLYFDDKVLRYRNEQGLFVKAAAIDAAMEAGRAETRNRLEKLAGDLKSGGITLAQWQLSARDEIKAQHLLAGAIARGGKAQLSQADYGRIGQITREQYAYLNKFAAEIASGKQKMDGNIERRLKMYADASRKTFSQMQRNMLQTAGYTEERNVLHAKETCPGCQAEAAKGWVDVGTISPVGTRNCKTNCRCQLIFRKAA